MEVRRGIVISFPAVEKIADAVWEARGTLAWAGHPDGVVFGATPVTAHTRDEALRAATERARRVIDDALAVASRSTLLGALQRLVLDGAKLGDEVVEIRMAPDVFEHVVRKAQNEPQPPRQVVGLPIGLFVAVASPTLRGALVEVEVQADGKPTRVVTVDLSVSAPASGYPIV